MELPFRYLRFRLRHAGLLPASRLARIAWYLLGLDIFLFGLQLLLGFFHISYGRSLGGWVSFLSFVLIILFSILAYRWLKARLLWRLRNRLIVTYVFIGVIPAILLIAMAGISIYLFAGQFANFLVTSELGSRLESLESANSAIAYQLAAMPGAGEEVTGRALQVLRTRDAAWANRQLCAWRDGKSVLVNSGPASVPAIEMASFLKPPFSSIVRDRDQLHLRAATKVDGGTHSLVVVTSEALDRALLEKIAASVGEITLYVPSLEDKRRPSSAGAPTNHNPDFELRPALVVGTLPPSAGVFDHVITFGTPIPVIDWSSGTPYQPGAIIQVQTRPSALYARLFSMTDFAKSVEYALVFVAVIFALIELLALWIGTRLTRTVTRSVAQLYDATRHINRGDFSHRIPVKSTDQLATLANSFNSMAASLQQLVEEQKQKQRLENELAIAQEVQAQLFPRHISQLPTLEVHGFCRPARTVSGDYYDFLTVDSDKMILAVGDVSGKGISAALLMATIHSAVRAYSLEGIPILREPVAVGAAEESDSLLSAGLQGVEVSPATMLGLLNHQLFSSTPAEKYATLFLGYYHGIERRLTYSNAGHLPPLILSQDGSIRRLDCGGTVIGLFDQVSYEERSVPLDHGEIFLAYSDGITEPENDFGEFGEQRLIELVWENRTLPLPKISEIVTGAVDDWIGANEQPDDVTLVLARAQ